MTVGVAWVRKSVGHPAEIMVAADSRLRSVGYFDAGPKIVLPSRQDCAMCFGGDTRFAYPMMLQLLASTDSYRPTRTRADDLSKVRGHLLRVFNGMLNHIEQDAHEEGRPEDNDFILAGYSWKHQQFQIFRAAYDHGTRKFAWHNAELIDGRRGHIAFVGDMAAALKAKIVESLRGQPTNRWWEMEPFVALRDLIRAADRTSTIGPPIQLARVMPYPASAHQPVFWPARGTATLNGRTLLDYENCDQKVLDPDTLDYHWHNRGIDIVNDVPQTPAGNGDVRSGEGDPIDP